MQNEWNCSMNVTYCTVLLRDAKHQPNIPKSPLPPCPFAHPHKNKTADWPWEFFFLSGCYRFVSHRTRNSFMYICTHKTFLYFSTFSFYFLHFQDTLHPCIPPPSLFPSDCFPINVRILPISGRITACLCKGTAYLKISMRNVCLSTISGKK